MKKTKLSLLYVLGIVFIGIFIFSLINDYTKYYPYGSSPFYLYVIERFIEFMVPAIICFVVGRIKK